MKQKTFLIILACCFVVSVLFICAYQLGSSSGYAKGYPSGFDSGKASSLDDPTQVFSNAYTNGYQAGLKDAQSGVTPSP